MENLIVRDLNTGNLINIPNSNNNWNNFIIAFIIIFILTILNIIINK
jgi:hypothetical protein